MPEVLGLRKLGVGNPVGAEWAIGGEGGLRGDIAGKHPSEIGEGGSKERLVVLIGDTDDAGREQVLATWGVLGGGVGKQCGLIDNWVAVGVERIFLPCQSGTFPAK